MLNTDIVIGIIGILVMFGLWLESERRHSLELKKKDSLIEHLTRLSCDRLTKISDLEMKLLEEQGAHAWTEARLSMKIR